MPATSVQLGLVAPTDHEKQAFKAAFTIFWLK
jgi:hypothetical protein